MKSLQVFRHEFKYIIPYHDYLKLRSRLDEVLELDQNHEYPLRSMYFDTYNDDDYYAKLNGDINRKKVRIRIYDVNDDWAKLEIKAKHDIHQLKKSLIISKEDVLQIINKNYEVLNKYDSPLANEIYEILEYQGYTPAVIIEYNRVAYVSKMGSRITFDLDVKESKDFNNFYDKNLNYYKVTDGKDVILEVKFDRFLEPYISKILESHINRFQSVSKYVLGRNV